MPGTKAAGAAYDADTAVGRGDNQTAYLHAVAVDKRNAVHTIKQQIAGMQATLKTAEADARAATKAAREAGAE